MRGRIETRQSVAGGRDATQSQRKSKGEGKGLASAGRPSETCQVEATGRQRRRNALGTGGGGTPSFGVSSGPPARVLVGCDKGRLLWRTGEICVRGGQDGNGVWGNYTGCEGKGHQQRGDPEGSFGQPPTTLPSPRVPGGLWAPGCGGPQAACNERAPTHSRRRRAVDRKLGDQGSRGGGGRECGPSTTGCPPTGRSSRREVPTRRSGGRGPSPASRREVRREEEEEEEKEKRKEGAEPPGRASPGRGSAEGGSRGVRRDRNGPQGADQASSAQQSPALCVKQKDTQHQRINEFEQFVLQQPGGGQGSDHGVCRRDEDQRSGRAIPGLPGGGIACLHEEVPPDRSRRRPGGGGLEASSTAVLPQCAGQEGQWAAIQGDAQSQHGSRPVGEGAHSLCRRRDCPTAEGPRVDNSGDSLGHCPEARGPANRGRGDCSPDRITTSPTGRLRRCKSAMEVTEHQPGQRRVEREVQRTERRSRALEERGAKRGVSQEGKGKGQKVSCPPVCSEESRRVAEKGRAPPDVMTGGDGFTACDRAGLVRPGHGFFTGEVARFERGQKSPCLSPEAPLHSKEGSARVECSAAFGQDARDRPPGTAQSAGGKGGDLSNLVGLGIHELGLRVHQKLLEVSSLRSSNTGMRKHKDLFPLPTSRSLLVEMFPALDEGSMGWLLSICVSLNCIWGGQVFYEGQVSAATVAALKGLHKDVVRLQLMTCRFSAFCWDDFFSTRGIDYKGDEVKTAMKFCWDNIAPALPAEIGRVPLEEVCTLGARHYVENFDAFLKDQSDWVLAKSPRVMVADDDWEEVCRGLVSAGICAYLPVEEVFDTGQGPLLNGLFGVSKEEWVGETEVYRLIMNLIPLNRLAHPLKGDVETLPSWSLMNPYFLQPTQNLLVSSEDVRCFFYTMAVPQAWYKYLAFNKRVPAACLPPELKGREVYLCSRVLPMGFLNSVSLAQHVHRNLTLWSGRGDDGRPNPPEAEIRKDRPLTVHDPAWRIYLDNYMICWKR